LVIDSCTVFGIFDVHT